MILPAQEIEMRRGMILPFHHRSKLHGMTYGLGPASYDVRIAQAVQLGPRGFSLASTIERFSMPNDICARVHDKSTWARIGVALQCTFIDPGWRGYLTLELSNNTAAWVNIPQYAPIAQIVFERLMFPTMQPYSGKYQDQPNKPVQPINE